MYIYIFFYIGIQYTLPEVNNVDEEECMKYTCREGNMAVPTCRYVRVPRPDPRRTPRGGALGTIEDGYIGLVVTGRAVSGGDEITRWAGEGTRRRRVTAGRRRWGDGREAGITGV